MALLKGTGDNSDVEIKIKCVARLPKSGSSAFNQVKFDGIFRVPTDRLELKAIRERIIDPDDDYGDEDLLEDHFVRWDNMPGPDGGFVECSQEARDEAFSNAHYFRALAQGCAEALFGAEVRRKN